MFDLKHLKEKAADLAETHGEAIGNGLEKVGDFIDDKTDGKYSEKIDTAVDKAENYIEKLGDRKDAD